MQLWISIIVVNYGYPEYIYWFSYSLVPPTKKKTKKNKGGRLSGSTVLSYYQSHCTLAVLQWLLVPPRQCLLTYLQAFFSTICFKKCCNTTDRSSPMKKSHNLTPFEFDKSSALTADWLRTGKLSSLTIIAQKDDSIQNYGSICESKKIL